MKKDRHVAGDTFDETVVIPDYPASDGWTLKYFFVPRFTTPVQLPITVTATTNANGADYDLQASPANTAGWKPGIYSWRRRVEKTGAAQTLDKQGNAGDWSGEFVVEPDPSTMVQGDDGRSQAQKALEDAKTGFAVASAPGSSVLRYTIGTRMMEFNNIKEAQEGLRGQINFWQREVDNEEAQSRLAKGQSGAARLLARL